ncbi:MAG: DUF5908 family protein [Bacteroidota bacterium]
MPIEINELVIKTNITQSPQSGEGEQRAAMPSGQGEMSPHQKAMIIQECVDQVLSILERQKSR